MLGWIWLLLLLSQAGPEVRGRWASRREQAWGVPNSLPGLSEGRKVEKLLGVGAQPLLEASVPPPRTRPGKKMSGREEVVGAR